jgi:hypothetical protein
MSFQDAPSSSFTVDISFNDAVIFLAISFSPVLDSDIAIIPFR